MTQTAKNVTSTAVASGAAVASGGAGVAENMAQAAAGDMLKVATELPDWLVLAQVQ